jgi:hypothetical protein
LVLTLLSWALPKAETWKNSSNKCSNTRTSSWLITTWP